MSYTGNSIDKSHINYEYEYRYIRKRISLPPNTNMFLLQVCKYDISPSLYVPVCVLKAVGPFCRLTNSKKLGKCLKYII